MAIFTVTSNAVENVDIFVDIDFKAGMALMRDDNGRVVKADNSLIFQKTLSQKIGKFLGFATSDHSSSANTIIVPDVIGSSYIDNSYSFIRTENNEVLTTKRALNDNLNESLNKPYNPSENLTISRRGLAVYNQPNNIFITDQFVRVLHGDYGVDFTTQIDFNSGDLLTFGSGANAGKLVKVNVNSISQEILIVGVVEKFIASTNLLHFRQVFYSHPFSNDSAVMVLDAGNSLSYSGSTSILANDLSLLSINDGTLTNGVGYSTNGGGSWSFDGTNDYINIPRAGLVYGAGGKTLMAWAKLTVNTGNWQIITGYGNPSGGNAFFIGVNGLTTAGGGFGDDIISGTATLNTWFHLCLVYNGSTAYLYLNTVLTVSASKTWNTLLSSFDGAIGRQMNPQQYWNGNISDVRLYNRALSASEILAYYNNTKSRYGL